MLIIISFLLSFIGILFIPSQAFAWGPITHLAYGTEVLNNLSLLSYPLQELLRSFPNDYLYGCIAADITLKKDLVDYLHNCHNWDVGLNLLKRSKSPEQQAFAYGYLSHLAADTISHNYYVPYHVVASYPTKTLKHIYWELRFDATRDKKFWKMAKELVLLYDKSEHDSLLKKNIKRTLFSFRTNKFIFNRLMHLENSPHWYQLVKSVVKRSVWKLSEEDVREFETMAFEAMIDFLNYQKKSKYYSIDPSGKNSLQHAKSIRKFFKSDLRKASRRKITEELSQVRSHFKVSLFHSGHAISSK